MGVIVFLLFMCFILVVGIVCLIVTAKAKMPVLLRGIFLQMIIIPVIFLLLIRFTNEQDEAGYQDTGTMIEWTKPYQEFVYNGKTYQEIKDLCILGDTQADWTVGSDVDKKLVFNIEPKKSFLDHIFGSNEKEEVYLIKNVRNVELYDAHGLYAEKKRVPAITKFYEEDKNYDFYLCDDAWEGDSEETEKVKISNEDWEKLCDLSKESQNDLILDEELQDEVDRNGCYLFALSKDKVVEVSGPCVFFYHDVWYVLGEGKEIEDELFGTAAKIPENIAEKFIQ